MGKRLVPGFLIALLLVVHAQLWFGRGSVGNVEALRAKLEAQQAANARAQQANDQLASEVRDLRAFQTVIASTPAQNYVPRSRWEKWMAEWKSPRRLAPLTLGTALGAALLLAFSASEALARTGGVRSGGICA